MLCAMLAFRPGRPAAPLLSAELDVAGTGAEARRGEPDLKELGETLLSLSARLYRLQAEAIDASGVPLSFQQFRILSVSAAT